MSIPAPSVPEPFPPPFSFFIGRVVLPGGEVFLWGLFFPSSIQSLSPHNGKPAREVLYSQSQVLQKCLITTTTTSADTGSKSVIKNTKNEPVVGRDIFYVA